MYRDLLDALRCPGEHEESWLVAVVHRASGARLLDVDLACPVCQREFTVRGGVADFRFEDARSGDASNAKVSSAPAPDPLRLAALLSLSPDAGPMSRPVLLAGAYAAVSAALPALIDVPQVLINPETTAAAHADAALSVLRAGDRVPLGVATLHAAALDAAHGQSDFVASVVRALRAAGRLVAPISLPLPQGVREIARDEHEWVAEVVAQGHGLVELRRQSAPSYS
jgi:uncharacterized protein YbaR (Trm112 family)